MRIKNYIIKKIFQKKFLTFVYPFHNADEVIDNLSQEDRMNHYDSASRFYKSKAYKIEMDELTRTFFEELAVKTQKEPEFSAYRLCLLFIQRMNQRFKYLSDKIEFDTAMKENSNKFK